MSETKEVSQSEKHGSPMQKQSIFDVLSPMQTFVGGIAAGIMLLCTIGFVVLLTVYIKTGFAASPVLAAGNQVANGQAAAQQAAGQVPTAANITVRDVDPKNDHIRGNAKAKITIVEYSDFECPFCKRFHNTMQQVMDTYGDDVRWVYRQFPIDGLHAQARTEALASECAAEQGKFWEFADLIFARTNGNDSLDLSQLPAYATELGLNVNQFNECLSTKKYAQAVQEDEADATAAGARGTPYSVLIGPNGEKIPISGAQPFATVEAAIKSFL